ncbi:MAG: hypothetical protein JXB35_02320 [Anaerolineae bacterium]|nr:hypothetical protein [Anaerolineae bacterium]
MMKESREHETHWMPTLYGGALYMDMDTVLNASLIAWLLAKLTPRAGTKPEAEDRRAQPMLFARVVGRESR